MAYSDEVLADGPHVYYRLGESVAPLVNLGAAGTFANLNTFNNPTLGQASLVGDSTDAAASFDGSAYAYTVNNAISNSTSLTIEFWMKTSVVDLVTVLSRDSTSSTSKIWYVRTNFAGSITFTNLGANSSITGATNVCDGKAHHIVIVVNGTAMTLYVDGVQDASGTAGGTLRSASSIPLMLARTPAGGTQFKGVLDEVALYNKVLTPTRIAAHTAAAVPAVVSNSISVNLTGNGTMFLTSHGATASNMVEVALSGEGALSLDLELRITPQITMEILDPVIDQAPTPVTVVLVEGVPEAEVNFYVDGVLVGSAETDSDGYLAPTSINVPESVGTAGDHVLTAVQSGAFSGSATFTLRLNPSLYPTVMGPDAQAVEVPGVVRPNGTRRWVLQDLLPGGLGSWIMPTNPAEGSSPYLERTYATKVTTAGHAHISEGSRQPVDWTFSGIAPDEEFAEKLLAYFALNRRFYVINHRNQAFKVVFTNVELKPRLQKYLQDATHNGYIDGHDYTVTALVLDQHWMEPA